MGKEGSGVDEDGVASDGLDAGHSTLGEQFAEVPDLGDAVGEVLFVHHLPESHGQCFQVTAGEAAVGGEAFEEDDPRDDPVVHFLCPARHEAADVHQGVLLAGHGDGVGGVHGGLQDLRHGHVPAVRLPVLDEPGVLRHAGGVEEQGNAVPFRHGGHVPEVLQAHGLSSAGVVGDGHHDEGNVPPVVGEGLFKLGDVHVALEGVRVLPVEGLLDDAVHGGCLRVEDVPPGGVEGHVEGNHVPFLHERAEDHVLGGPALVDGNGVVEAQDVLHRLLQAVEAVRPGVGLVAHHDGGPLLLAHGARA